MRFLEVFGRIRAKHFRQTTLLLLALPAAVVPSCASDRATEQPTVAQCEALRDHMVDVRQGRFRQDLFFRLRVASLNVPPLRERLGDIPVLAQMLLDRARSERGLARIPLSLDALGALVVNPWPGNVRELKHAMEEIGRAHV